MLLPQVICLAVFFALVIKKVDEEDYQNVDVVRSDRNPGKRRTLPKINVSALKFSHTTHNSSATGNCKDGHTFRQNSSLYEPPAPTDIERMRHQKIMEQKAFVILREILSKSITLNYHPNFPCIIHCIKQKVAVNKCCLINLVNDTSHLIYVCKTDPWRGDWRLLSCLLQFPCPVHSVSRNATKHSAAHRSEETICCLRA